MALLQKSGWKIDLKYDELKYVTTLIKWVIILKIITMILN